MKKILKDQSRRSFIKKSVAGLAGVSVMPTLLQQNSTAAPVADKGKIIIRKLGNTGLKLPIVSIGAASYDVGLFKTALDSGVTHIDTSQYYYNGRHEKVVGEAVKGRPRDSYVIATSILLGSGKEGRNSTLAIKDASQLVEKFDSSLERLGLDYVDIFYVAGTGSREVTFDDSLLSGLKKLKKDGKTRFIGVATHQNEPEVIRAAIEAKHDAVLVAYNFRQRHQAEVKKAMAEANQAGVGIVVMKPMAGAFWDRERKQPINGKAALKWVLQDENVHTAVPGISSMEQLKTDLSIMENLALTPEEKLDLKLKDTQTANGLYCQQCGECTGLCPADLDIPTIMRGYMYAYGYQDYGKARGVLDQVDLSAVGCSDCSSCRVVCSTGFNVKEKIQDITRLVEIPEEFIA